MFKRICLLGFLLVLGQPTLAQTTYHAFPSSSKVGFSLRHFTNTADGEFGKFSGTLEFSKQHPENSSIEYEVDVASVDTGNGTRDDHLRGDEYFEVKKYPKMTFESKAFKNVGKNKYMVTGALTIKGHSKNISVPVTLAKTQSLWASGEEALTFDSTFAVNRTEFGVGEESSLLGSEVTVSLHLEFRTKPK